MHDDDLDYFIACGFASVLCAAMIALALWMAYEVTR